MPIDYWLKYGNTPLGYNGSGVKFVHVEQPGTLTVSVQVSGTGFDPSKTFGFRVAFGSPIDYTVNGVAIPASSDAYTGSLANGQSVVLGNIPYGTAYSVTEDTLPSTDTDAGYFNDPVTGASGTMPEGGALTSVAKFLYDTDSEMIGGSHYKVVTIGDYTYMAENLDCKWSGLTIVTYPGSTGQTQAGYYDGDEATYGSAGNRYGLLYNLAAFNYMATNAATLFPGWHVMTRNEYTSLYNAAGSSGTALKSSVSWDGTDTLGFNAVPAGYGSGGSAGRWSHVGDQTYIAVFRNRLRSDILYLSTGDPTMATTDFDSQYVSVRLVKD